jgi:2,4-dienoyl-CoA reductase-like NADH-dependent reductase (Old Yellow Enzyme family)
MSYRRIAQLRTAEQLKAYLTEIGVDLPFDETVEIGDSAPLAQPYKIYGKTLSNRFAVLPMEGWDANAEGHPTDLVKRRWQRFGLSGAKLIWGGEAVAVRHDGRANPRQVTLNAQTEGEICGLREALVESHQEHHGDSENLLIGLQLTHSGRFCRPNTEDLEPKILYRHPLLDKKFHLTEDYPVMTDAEIDDLIEDFVIAARRAQNIGFDFVDIKHCHGYLGHEFLSAIKRPGRYGGSFENRTRFLREVVAGIRTNVPGLHMGVRLSAFDLIPFNPNNEGVGEPVVWTDGNYPYAFGGNGNGTTIDLTETFAFLKLLQALDIQMVCITAGSPYYTPHIQRPALFPPSDGYQAPEDPLVGVARHISVTAQLKEAFPDLLIVGSGYSYLQEWLPNVAQNVVRTEKADFIGVGRMILSYPEMPADILSGKTLARKRICRTFSDCTTSPRNGMVSGCFPLDEFYKAREEAQRIIDLKKRSKESVGD